MVYIKSLSEFRTRKMIQDISHKYPLGSYADDSGSVVVPERAADIGDAGSWLIALGKVFYISSVVPGDGKTTIKIEPPHKAFDRQVVYPGGAGTTAAFLAGVLESEFRAQTDPAYRIGALRVVSATNRAFIKPDEVGDDTTETIIFYLYNYIVKLRNSYNIYLDFSFSQNVLTVTICEHEHGEHNIVFGDGKSILDSEAYGGSDTVAKVSVLHGQNRTDFYLTEFGGIQNTVPAVRVPGSWKIVKAKDDATEDELLEDAKRAFGDGAGAHKVEFWSEREMALGDVVVMRLNGVRVVGCISAVSLESGNARWHYAVGDLDTTLTAKIRKRG